MLLNLVFLFLCSAPPSSSAVLLSFSSLHFLSPLPRLRPRRSFTPSTPQTSFCSTPSYTNRFYTIWVCALTFQSYLPSLNHLPSCTNQIDPPPRAGCPDAEGRLDRFLRTLPILIFSPCFGRKKLATSTSRTASNDNQLQPTTKELGQASLSDSIGMTSYQTSSLFCSQRHIIVSQSSPGPEPI